MTRSDVQSPRVHAGPVAREVELAGTAHKILIVEDEFLIRLTLSEVLADEGYQVLEAETGEQAESLLVANPDVSVLLTDLQLPGSVNGHAVVAKARERSPDLPVIFMTGRPDSFMRSGGREMFVTKPYLPSEICAAVKRMLAS